MIEKTKQILSNLGKYYEHVLYAVRSSLLVYVAYIAFMNQFYFLSIAFAYFAFVDYQMRYRLVMSKV
jgi:hypothetical protein